MTGYDKISATVSPLQLLLLSPSSLLICPAVRILSVPYFSIGTEGYLFSMEKKATVAFDVTGLCCDFSR